MKVDEVTKKRYDILGQEVVKELKKRNFTAYYVESGEEAKELALKLIPEGSSVSWGGSMTLNEIGLKKAIKEGNYTAIDREEAKNPQERNEIMKKGLYADYFLMSANAMSREGIMVNIDGLGNRIASLLFGPEHVIVISGMNKVEESLEDAIRRARYKVAPINGQRFDRGSFCSYKGYCGECTGNQSICSHMAITRTQMDENRIVHILVGENLGF